MRIQKKIKNGGKMITTERLIIEQATDSEMLALIENAECDEMKQAYAEMYESAMLHKNERQWYVLWFIKLKGSITVGELCFKGIIDGTVEIGYGTYEGFTSKGYMTEAVNGICDWAQGQAGVIRIEAEAEEANTAGIRVLEKAGFIKNGKIGVEGPRFVRRAFPVNETVTLTPVTPEGFNEITDFYKAQINSSVLPSMIWQYGIHPNDEKIMAYIQKGEMYCYKNGEILCAVAIQNGQAPEYDSVSWQGSLASPEVATLHLLCVNQARLNEGIARSVVKGAVCLAQAQGKKAVRLDTHSKNYPAQHLYSSLGFTPCGSKTLTSQFARPVTFLYYEYLI